MYGVVEFICWVAVVALTAAFLLALAVKWGWLEWLQVHAPNDFFYKLFSCKFCCSWWLCLIISLSLCVITGQWHLIAAPVCATLIARDLC